MMSKVKAASTSSTDIGALNHCNIDPLHNG